MQRKLILPVSIWLALAVSTSFALDGPVVVAAGQSLADALADHLAESPAAEPGNETATGIDLAAGDWYFASDGLPEPLTEASDLGPGLQRVLLLRRADSGVLEPRQWVELDVQGGRAATRGPAALAIDDQPPQGQFSIIGAVSGDDDRLLASPSAVVRLTLRDSGGVDRWQIIDSHHPSSENGRWLEGQHTLTARARDDLGNEGTAGSLEFTVDATGPEVAWVIDSPGFDAGNSRTLYLPPVALSVTASDDAGVARLEIDDGENLMPVEPGQKLMLQADSATIQATDTLGNVSRAEARWEIDGAGPQISLVPEGDGRVRGNRVTLPVAGSVEVQIHDAGAGFDQGRYRYNQKPWKPLPERIRFMHRGRYKVWIEAVDRLGNASLQQFEVRTSGRAPRRGGRS